jgi:gluconate 2-dehydrogenase subunit 3-like protein
VVHDDRSGLGRREVIQRLAMSVGGLLSFPAVAFGHPIQHHLRDADLVGAADARAAGADYKPEFLDPRAFGTLQVLAERIVPGSNEARSSEFIDQLLTVTSADEQRTFLQALGGFEQFAMARARVSWKALSEQQQNELLTIASTEKSGKVSDAPAGASANAHVTIRDHFENLKGWIVGAYYSSEIGMRELGWTGTVFFAAFPGCEHPDGHR